MLRYLFLVVTVISLHFQINHGQPLQEFPITAYDYQIKLVPDFSGNTVESFVTVHCFNDSAISLEFLHFALLTITDVREMNADIHEVIIEEELKSYPAEFERITSDIGQYYKNCSYYRIYLENPLNPGDTIMLNFHYTLKGKEQDECLPLKRGLPDELYLLSDFQWLPQPLVAWIPGQSPDDYKPTWNLAIQYPASYTAIAGGQLLSRTVSNGIKTDVWKSLLNGFPEIFCAEYLTKVEKGNQFDLEIYSAGKKSLDLIDSLSARIFDIIEYYSHHYCSPEGNIFRIVLSATPGGGHGIAMGALVDYRMISSIYNIETVAHELAHTWWGEKISSYGPGTKFLREAMASFSAAASIEQIFGQSFADNIWRSYKIRFLYDYYLSANHMQAQFPLILLPEYNHRGVLQANYTKGPLVLKTIRDLMGPGKFDLMMKSFSTEFENKNVAISDFMDHVVSYDGTMEELLRNYLWGVDLPICHVANLTTTETADGFETRVTYKNDGTINGYCSLQIQSHDQIRPDWISVPGKSDTAIIYITDQKITNFLIDPDLTQLNHAPERAAEFWMKFDDEYLGVRWWYRYNKSYAFYLDGKPEMAIDNLSDCFTRYFQYTNLSSWENASDDIFLGAYLYARAIFYLEAHQNEKARDDLKMAIPYLMESFTDRIKKRVILLTGMINKDDPNNHISAILSSLTGKDFSLPDGISEEETKSYTEEWKSWWNEEGQKGNLNIEAYSGLLHNYPAK
ncbi:MAG: hypothetical protein AMS27_10275 [Bacteroides sp. SM23_62_1]|nr:MAG: hypothetical protein AMS27_10275 [Bacteroides sp. SM23_62_1]